MWVCFNEVRDAISDLPEIQARVDEDDKNVPSESPKPYVCTPQSQFQRVLRVFLYIFYFYCKGYKQSEVVRQHVVRSLSGLVHRRITLIPKLPGADWRDLPNIEDKELEVPQLKYTHHDFRVFISRTFFFTNHEGW